MSQEIAQRLVHGAQVFGHGVGLGRILLVRGRFLGSRKMQVSYRNRYFDSALKTIAY